MSEPPPSPHPPLTCPHIDVVACGRVVKDERGRGFKLEHERPGSIPSTIYNKAEEKERLSLK
ncbi:hypothetical protein ACTXT7_005061 [Hymenolepis weldensis]